MTSKKWDMTTVRHLFELPFIELLFQAQTIHRQHFDSNEMELCTLLNIKTGTCPENCSYCPQSGHYQTGLQKENLWSVAAVVKEAEQAKAAGAKRFCMGAAWRNPPAKEFPKVLEMIAAVKDLGLETCVTLGMLDDQQASELAAVGLDYYNHNLDTSRSHYPNIATTRTYDERLDTLARVQQAGINVCCGGIMGMNESREDRIEFLLQLANMDEPPQSVPINRLIPITGTPLEHADPIDNIEFIRTIAVARILMPRSMVRLSAGRESMSEEMHALCFMAGANSIFLGEKMLVTKNRGPANDLLMLEKFGMKKKD